MTCRIRNNKGLTEQGTISPLYVELLDYTDNNNEEALELFALSLTPEFERTGVDPTLSNILNYAEIFNTQTSETLSSSDIEAITNIQSKDPSFIQEFIEVFRGPNGRFNIDFDKMSRIYSQSEIERMDFDIVRSTYYKVLNSEEIIENIPIIDADFLVEDYDSGSNIFGKVPYRNPDEVYYDIFSHFAGVTDMQEFEDRLSTFTNDTLRNKIESDTKFRNNVFNKVISSKSEVRYEDDILTGNLVKATTNNIKSEILQSYDPTQDTQGILSEINYLLNIPLNIYADALTEISDIATRVELAAIDLGIDFRDFSNKFINARFTEGATFLNSFKEFLQDPVARIEDFTDNYNKFFNISPQSKLAIKPNDLKSTMHIDTVKTELELYRDYSLIKTGENSYMKVEKQPLDVLLENSDLIKHKVPTNIERYIDEKARELQDYSENVEMAKELIFHKIYFNKSVDSNEFSTSLSEEYNNWLQIDRSFNEEDFFKMLNVEKINKNLPIYFTNSGIEMEYDGDYTLYNTFNKMSPNLQSQFIQYSIRNHKFQSIIPNIDIPSVMNIEFLREIYQHQPHRLENYKGEIEQVGENAFKTMSPIRNQFLRIGDTVYEKAPNNIFIKMGDMLPNDILRSTQSTQYAMGGTETNIIPPSKLREDIDSCGT